MIKFVLFLVLCAFTGLSSAGSLSGIFSSNWPFRTISDEAPWFCHGIDCAKFELKDTYKSGDVEIELRSYEGGKWASTKISDVDYDKAVRTGFFRLFSYISGSNEEKQKIEMTAPVKTMVTPGEGPFCESHFTVSFFVPFDFQDKVPTPTSADVFIEDVPAASYYVLSYPGYTSESKMLDEAIKAVEALEDLKLAYDNSTFYTAGYDPPFRLLNRHNEVWIPAA
eukprot:gene18456-24936_t